MHVEYSAWVYPGVQHRSSSIEKAAGGEKSDAEGRLTPLRTHFTASYTEHQHIGISTSMLAGERNYTSNI